jgi:carboxylesterase type B
VNTHCGQVHEIHSTSYVFKGIPYALLPTTQRRWKPPEPLNRSTNTYWPGTFNASMFGNTCIQRSMDNSGSVIGSEDSLFLNVWTPTLDKNANLAVMVWIHGGSLQIMNGNWPGYSPTTKSASTTSTVYVSINYCLHVFGFMAQDIWSSPSPNNVSGNYGFMDQQLALQWVQMNIKNFGGNPNLVSRLYIFHCSIDISKMIVHTNHSSNAYSFQNYEALVQSCKCNYRHRRPKPNLSLLCRPFGCIAPKHF